MQVANEHRAVPPFCRVLWLWYRCCGEAVAPGVKTGMQQAREVLRVPNHAVD